MIGRNGCSAARVGAGGGSAGGATVELVLARATRRVYEAARRLNMATSAKITLFCVERSRSDLVSANVVGDGGTGLTDSEQRVLAAIDEEATLELMRELIRCPSENPPGQEEATVRALASFFERHGIAHRLEEIQPGRPNLIAELGTQGGPTLVFNGHTDTVPIGAGWTTDPFGAELRDGKVFGRGACDMLAGVTAMSAAAAALHASGVALNGRLQVHACIDEEVDAIGSQHAARDTEADWVIVTEPSGGKIEAFGKGQLNVEIVFHGKAAHSSRPDLGRNAIHDAAAFIAAVERANAEAAAKPYPDVGPVTYTSGIIEGGNSGSIVAAQCTLTLDRRLLPTETLEEAEADVRRLLDHVLAERPGMEATMRSTLRFPPLPPVADTRLAETVQGAVRELGGGSASLSGATGATDAAWYAARGIPTVIYGPGDGNTAHQPDEFVLVNDLQFGARALALTAIRLLGAETA
jgi:acetylornithine deacetylase/succinyl-diaminopimelate desuccinylase family protein